MLRPSTLRPVFRTQCRAQVVRATRASPQSQTCRTFLADKRSGRATQDFDLNKLNTKRRDYEQNRTAFLAAGAIAGIVSFIYTAYKLKNAIAAQSETKDGKPAPSSSVRLDAPQIPTEQFKTEAGEKRKVVVHDEDGNEIVPTGNSVVQAFPRTIDIRLPHEQRPENPIAASISDNEGTEFSLVGLGTRTVTFLGIQVYVVGFYVATQDVAKLQHYLVKKINSVATTLIPSEKDTLRKSLLDPTEGEETWNAILRDAGVRSAFRIIPVKDTDFHHLRDAFVRAITGRTQRDSKAYADEQFGENLKNMRALFNRGSFPKKRELLLVRDGEGQLSMIYSGSDQGSQREVVGVVPDERISRLIWLNYLAGSKVASEAARQNIITGVMEFVERPVGTVATQVV
jgi:hypothetical protein